MANRGQRRQVQQVRATKGTAAFQLDWPMTTTSLIVSIIWGSILVWAMRCRRRRFWAGFACAVLIAKSGVLITEVWQDELRDANIILPATKITECIELEDDEHD